MLDNMFKGIIGKVKPGACRLSINGRIAIRTNDGYKTYNPKKGTITNCSNFVIPDFMDDMFMVIPTRKLKVGDIVIMNGKFVYVIEVNDSNVKAVSYEDSTVNTYIPERYAILGRKFYGKVVSLFGNGLGNSKGGMFKNLLKIKMMSSFMGGNRSTDDNEGGMFSGNALPMMMLMGNGSMDGMFDGLFDQDESDDEGLGNLFNMDDDEDEDEDEKSIKRKSKKRK